MEKLSDEEKLLTLAKWLDVKFPGQDDEVQQDLRKIAKELSDGRRAIVKIKELRIELWTIGDMIEHDEPNNIIVKRIREKLYDVDSFLKNYE